MPFARTVILSILFLGLSSGVRPTFAQDSTTGSIRGQVSDQNGDPLAGVTVVATSPVLQGSASEISDSGGRYRLDNLPPGFYLLTFYYSSVQVRRPGIDVPLGQVTTVNQVVDTTETAGEVIEIDERGSTIDTTSTNQGTRITQDQFRNIPLPGRTFGSALGQAAGSQGDPGGVSFSGSTSLENQYVVDGVNTTGLSFGTIGTPLINEFIEEIQVVTGGYQAEYGRATGGLVNVVTKQGSNELRGSAFATMIPYTVNRTPVRDVKTSIDGVTDLDYSADFGVDLGGPVIKDRLWFYVGFAPQLTQTDIKRIVQRQTDCRELRPDGTLSECDPMQYMDGTPDEDPNTGDLIFEEVDRTTWKTNSQAYQWVSKVNFAANPENQGQLSLVGTPVAGQGIFGVTGARQAIRADFTGLTTDTSAKWTTKLNDNKTEIEGVVGWHRDKYDQDALDDSVLDTPTTRVYFSSLNRFGIAGRESPAVIEGCRDGLAAGDPYPLVENCPVTQYWLDSPGFTIDNLEDRKAGQLKVTQRVEAAGDHLVKVGVDVEDNTVVDVRHFTGGRYYQLITGGFNQVRIYRYVAPGEGGMNTCGFEGDEVGAPDLDSPRSCEYVDRAVVTGETVNWSTFAQDSWQIRPNLTLNAGMRYEEQRLRYAKEIRQDENPLTMEPFGRNAMVLKGMFAPRVGLLYDWTKQGRSKVYTHFGRFYESIPMAINDFSFSGTTLYGAFYNFEQCQNGPNPSQDSQGAAPSPYNCPEDVTTDAAPGAGGVYRTGTTEVAPQTRAQYMDEIILGSEYEVLEDLRVGAAIRRRQLGRVLEDVSIDDGQTYVIGNPGHFPASEEAALVAEIEGLPMGSPERARLEAQLEGWQRLREFDKPRRDYTALELTVNKRVNKNFYVQGSYTYSRTEGNYGGLLNADTGAANPNFSTQYDIIELMANRDGLLPQDRPHYFKFDGYYTFDLEEAGLVTTGIRFRALSGTPKDSLGGHYTYGLGESYLLPRGSQGRTEFVTGTDLRLGYGRKIGAAYELTVFADVINAFNQEQAAIFDELYTFDNANPIVGGDEEDLVFAKQITDDGAETTTPVTRNIGYNEPLARYTPLFLRIGARFTF